jgi:hypothetical protein
MIRANSIVSALNTNMDVTLWVLSDSIVELLVRPTFYFNRSDPIHYATISSPCNLKSPVVPSAFYSTSFDEIMYNHRTWPENLPFFSPLPSVFVDGFYGGCTPFDALLHSTLDCLYNLHCLENFIDYFPSINQVRLVFTRSMT